VTFAPCRWADAGSAVRGACENRPARCVRVPGLPAERRGDGAEPERLCGSSGIVGQAATLRLAVDSDASTLGRARRPPGQTDASRGSKNRLKTAVSCANPLAWGARDALCSPSSPSLPKVAYYTESAPRPCVRTSTDAASRVVSSESVCHRARAFARPPTRGARRRTAVRRLSWQCRGDAMFAANVGVPGDRPDVCSFCR
jgi:hypothetical protein